MNNMEIINEFLEHPYMQNWSLTAEWDTKVRLDDNGPRMLMVLISENGSIAFDSGRSDSMVKLSAQELAMFSGVCSALADRY